MSTTVSLFAAKIWIHSVGSLEAIRVVSRSPCPVSDSARAEPSESCFASSVAITCGTWETSATLSSCSFAVMSTGIASRSRMRSSTTPTTSAFSPLPVAITHGRPTNRSARAEIAPPRSRPASGCEPTYRLVSSPAACSSASGSTFTLATSVTIASGNAASSWAMTDPVWSGGTATTMSPGASESVAARPAP